MWAFSAIGSVLFIGLPFLTTHVILKGKKITGILPLGTTYNREAATYIVMMFLPLTLISTFIINFISLIAQSAMGVNFESGMENMTVTGIWDFLSLTLFVAIVPAILEEVAIRGVLLQPLRRFGDGFAIIVSAVIFSLLHGNMVQVPYTIVAGIYFGYVAVATGSIWPTIIMHFFNNFYSVLVTTFDSTLSVAVANVLSITTLGIMVVAGIFGLIKYKSMNYKVKLAPGSKILKRSEKVKAVYFNFPMVVAIIMMIITTLTSVSKI
jgi:membrane protease YdiL (CAAX protease family)